MRRLWLWLLIGDFCSDQWARMVGDEKWSWEGLLEYFKRCETFYPAESNTVDLERWHGFEGPVKVCLYPSYL